MGDSNELAGALAETSAAHMGNAVLGDDVVNIVFRGRADAPRGEDGLDLAYRAALCGRGERNEALAALGLACAADEVDLPPEPDMCFVPTDSAQTWPKKSTSMAAFMDIMLSFLQMTSGLFT